MAGASKGTALKRVFWLLLGLLLIAFVGAFAAMSCARVEMTAGGAHTRLMIPVGRAAIGIPIYSGSGEEVSIPDFTAGPVVRRGNDGRWTASWFCENAVQHARGRANALQITCAGKSHAFSLATAPTADAVEPMPEELVVLSDIEGNSEFLEAALHKLGVVDTSGNWCLGDGHIVILGDSVDRGRDVFAVLWRLHGLALQAHAAGGAVHVLLGNHEQYLLRGNISRAHPDYRYALQQLGGYAKAFADDSVLGEWLRDQPVVVKLGSVLFTHAGVSQQVVSSGFSVDALNSTMRNYWNTDDGAVANHSVTLDAVLGMQGVTQYRGYFRKSKGRYPLATQADIEKVLAYFNADSIVVAHTLVEKVTHKFNGRVIAIDVNDPEARTEVLRYSHGTPRIVDIGIKRGLSLEPPRRQRGFSLFDAADRQLLASMYQANRALSRVPHPY